MPQIEILGLEDLSAVLTHCGWGGTLECMGAGKPVICYPGFGDQMMNAKILHGKGCGPMLNPARAGARQIRNAVQDVVDNLGSYQCKAKDVSEQLKK
ncbi:UGT91C1, partial [Symbiodinium pilosum]